MALLMTGAKSRGEEIACDPAVIRQAWGLLKVAAYGQSWQEHAAFITRGADGRRSLTMWKFEHESCRATYSGARPEHVVAIIHTHPNSLPLPSNGDALLARHTRLPVYVVTRTMISRTDGRHTESVWDGDWNPGRAPSGARSICSANVAVAVHDHR